MTSNVDALSCPKEMHSEKKCVKYSLNIISLAVCKLLEWRGQFELPSI